MSLKAWTHDELVKRALEWAWGPLGAQYAITESKSGSFANGEVKTVEYKRYQSEEVEVHEYEQFTEEIPDVWAWVQNKKLKAMPYGAHTIQIECKASRSDFLSDKKKMTRQKPEQGAGRVRWYYCAPDICEPSEVPENWGLVIPVGTNRHKYLVKPKPIIQNDVGHRRDFNILRRIAQEYKWWNLELKNQLDDHDIEPTQRVPRWFRTNERVRI